MPAKTVLDREYFEARSIPEPNSGCQIWLGSTNERGYGTLTSEGLSLRAHRASYEVEFGPVPDGLFVCHKCDVTFCINPNHLFAGTSRENTIDCAKKGRIHRWTDRTQTSPGSKLREIDIPSIRIDPRSTNEIAEAYSVTRWTIRNIKTGRTWGHV